MAITTDTIKKHEELYKEWQEIDFLLRKAENEAKSDHADMEVRIKRPNGEEVEVKEKYIWIEARNGVEESLNFIYEKYPILKELNTRQMEKIEEIKKFEIENFGFTYKEMTMPNVIRLINALINK